MLNDYLECTKNAVKIHFKCRSIFFYFDCTSKVLNMRRTFRLVARMCPNVWNAPEILAECLECTSIVQECTTNFDSDGIPAHSESRVTRVLAIVDVCLSVCPFVRLSVRVRRLSVRHTLALYQNSRHRGYEISHPYPYPQIFRGYPWIYPWISMDISISTDA